MPSSTRVRVALQDRAVHEGARVAFVGVADHVLEVALGLTARLPLASRREAARRRGRAARRARPPRGPLRGSSRGLWRGRSSRRRRCSRRSRWGRGARRRAAGCAPDGGRRGCRPRGCAVGRSRGSSYSRRSSTSSWSKRLLDDLGHVLHLHALVQDALRVQQHQRSPLTEAVAARRAHRDEAVRALCGGGVAQGLEHTEGALRPAARAAADGDDLGARVRGGDERVTVAGEGGGRGRTGRSRPVLVGRIVLTSRESRSPGHVAVVLAVDEHERAECARADAADLLDA